MNNIDEDPYAETRKDTLDLSKAASIATKVASLSLKHTLDSGNKNDAIEIAEREHKAS